MIKLLIPLILFCIAANAQTIRWTSSMDLPLITQDKTVTNDTTVEKLLTISLPPGKTVKVEYSVVLVPLVIDVTQAAEQSGTYVSNGVIGGVDKADWLKWSVNLTGRTSIEYEYAMSDATNGSVEFRIGSITATPIAKVVLPPTGGWGNFVKIVIPITGATMGDLYVTFSESVRATGSGGNIKSIVVK